MSTTHSMDAIRRARAEQGHQLLAERGDRELAAFIRAQPQPVAAALLDQAVAHHRACEAQGRAAARPAVGPEALERLLVSTPLGPRLVARCPSLTSRAVFEGAAPLLFGQPMRPAPGPGRQLDQALELICQLREFDYVRDVFGLLICTGDPADTTHEAHGSNSGLIGSIYTVHLPEDLRFGEMLVHEAGHNWLSLCAQAAGESFANGAMFISPWKGTERPLEYFLQAVFAFTAVTRYYQLLSAGGLVPRSLAPVVAERLSWNLRQVNQCTGSLDQALALTCSAFRPVVEAPFRRVLAEGSIAA